jgi:UDP-hydrolysing UDP-N-acetyl-D-glucosamine 2-epimerase
MSIRKICVVTGSRAEYDLLYQLMNKLKQDSDFSLQVVVTGTHLSSEFGSTVDKIEEDGFIVDEKVHMLLSNDSPIAISKSIGLAVIAFADVFARLKPDLILILGDRFEILAVAQVAVIHQIPIAHIHGGEVTEGAYDDAIRHSLTKMSHYHFVAAEEYRKRVIQMGEDPKFVYNVGAPGIENLRKMDKLSKLELEQSLNFKLERPFFLVTFHPETVINLEGGSIDDLLLALAHFSEYSIIFTSPNADNGNKHISDAIRGFVDLYPNRSQFFVSLGRQRYLSLMHLAEMVIGNSSSGIIEAPALGVPTVNIGHRQAGRLMAESIVNTHLDRESIISAIEKVLLPDFKQKIGFAKSLYGKDETSQKILSILKQQKYFTKKQFFNINYESQT